MYETSVRHTGKSTPVGFVFFAVLGIVNAVRGDREWRTNSTP